MKSKTNEYKCTIPILSTKICNIDEKTLERAGTYIEEIEFSLGVHSKGKINKQPFYASFPSINSSELRPLYLSLTLKSQNIHYLELCTKSIPKDYKSDIIKFAIGYLNRKPGNIDRERLHNLFYITY